MKASIEVESKKEAGMIRRGLDDPATRALVIVMGALADLPSDRSRKRVLTLVADYFEEQRDSVEVRKD
ncbi:MAG: hypothetical protein ABW003_17260 [Microvirga sp.]